MRLQDIAKKLKVSSSTVSRALNPATEHLISLPIRQKIQRFAAQAGFVPNRTARELVTGRAHAIGVILSTSFHSLFFADNLAKVLSGVYAALEESAAYGCKLVVLPRGKPFAEADQHVLRTGIDGLLISSQCDFSAKDLHGLASQLQERWKRPVVALNLEPQAGSRVSIVSFDNRTAAYQAVAWLAQKGHRNIGLISADNGSADVYERLKGCAQAFKDHRLPWPPAWRSEGDFSPAGGYQAALPLFQGRGPKPTALFCINDEMAIGAIRAVKALGLRCPQEVAVIGFDGLDAGEFLDPRLSTMRQPAEELARAGTKLLIDLIEGRQTAPVTLTLKAELVVRDSA